MWPMRKRPMNERNVAALAELLKEMNGGGGDTWQEEARWLASRGVLVPSALTNEQVNAVPISATAWDVAQHPEQMRVALDRIAKGEA